MNQALSSGIRPAGRTNYRWLICTLLFLATTINYVDRQILALVKPILDAQLGWTNEQYGVVNSFFQGAYAVGLLGFGWFVDRFGIKIGYSVSIFFWSVAAISHSLVGSIGGFRAARVFLGVSEAGNFPSAIKTVAHWFPRKERAFATSIFNSGANVGAILAPAFVPYLARVYGWKLPFVLAGLAGFVWLFFWIYLYQMPNQHPRLGTAEREYIQSDPPDAATAGGGVPWTKLLGYRQTWTFIVSKALTDPVWWFFLTWLPDFFNNARHMDIKHFGPPIVVIYSMVTVLSIAGGYLANFLVRMGWSENKTRKLCMLFFALCVVPIVFVENSGLWTTIFLIGLGCSAHQAWSANLYTTVSDMFPKNAVAAVTGLGGTAGAIAGMCFPIYVGHLLDIYAKTGQEKVGYGIVFGICAGAYILAFVISHILAPRFEPVKIDGVAPSNDPRKA